MHIVLTILALRTGGAERDLCRVAKSLARDHRVTLVTLIVSKEERPFYPIDPAVRLVQLDLMRSLQDTLGFWPRAKEICLRPFCVLRYRRALKKLQPDVVISYLTKANILTLLATRGMGVPVIISKRVDARFLRYSWWFRKLRALMYPQADLIVAQTAEIETSLRSLRAPVVTIPNAVEPPKKYAVYPDPIVSIVSVGRLTEQKDFPTLLKAFRKIYVQAPHCKLYIYGEGPDRVALQGLIATFHLKKHAFLLGVVEDMPTVLSEAGIFVSSTRYEGFPNTLAEAMAVGAPVISSDRPENKALVSDGINGRLFPVGDADRLAELMAELMTDFEQRKRLGQEATKITQRFSLERNRILWQEAIKRVTVGQSGG